MFPFSNWCFEKFPGKITEQAYATIWELNVYCFVTQSPYSMRIVVGMLWTNLQKRAERFNYSLN